VLFTGGQGALRKIRAVARILIVAGGCRGRQLAAAMMDEGYAVRITTRSEEGRARLHAATDDVA